MFPRVLVAALMISLAAPAMAQIQRRPPDGEQQPQAQPPAPQPSAPPQRVAVPRQPAPPPTVVRSDPAPAPQPSASAPRDTSRENAAEQRRRPDGRQGGDRVAVPRTRPVPSDLGRGRARDRDRDRIIVAARPPYYYYPRTYYPRSYYPYGYGAFGLGYFYYDPWGWGPRRPLAYHSGFGPSYWGYGYSYDTGEVRLRVTPRDAQVFVDGYYAGVVDDFDGIMQSLRLESGGYRIEIRLAGYQTETFDVYVTPGRKVTYRAELRRLP